ncbi:MAG: fumarylacetoacetate hydrolase family protein [Pseudomonadota bacterium]
MATIIPAPTPPTLPIASSEDVFPVGRIFCVGRNYVDHIREMGGEPHRQLPVFFEKSPTCLVPSGATIPYPTATQELHHEVELLVALSSGGANIDAEDVADLILGYSVALDMTRRDLQAQAKENGTPWDMAKSFDHAAPAGALKLMPGKVLDRGSISLDVNGENRQSGDLNQMVWGLRELIASLSSLITLRAGDVIMTGTPAGVGPVSRGDLLEASIEGVGSLEIRYRG